MNVMNDTYDVKFSMLRKVKPAGVRISSTSSYSYGIRPAVLQESSGSSIFNIFVNDIYGSACSSGCLVVFSIKNAVDCKTFQSDSDATYKLCLHTSNDVLSTVRKSTFISI
jgi:hypothetical protein